MDGKVYEKIGMIALLSILIPLLFYSLYTTTWTIAYPQIFYVCLDYLEQGTLYGGQPFCEQGGPFMYYPQLMFRKIFGNFHVPTRILITILSVISIFLITRVSKKETGKPNAHFITILFLIILYPYARDNGYYYPFVGMLLFIGFYILYYLNIKFKEILAGVIFSVSAYTIVATIVPILLIILFYIFRVGIIEIKKDEFKDIRFLIKYKKISKIFLIILPILVFSIIFKLKYQNIFKYIIFSHLIDPVFTFSQALKNITPLGYANPFGYINQSLFVSYFILACCIFVFIKTRSVIPVIAATGFWELFNHHQHFGGLYFGKNLFISGLFLVLTFVIFKEKVEKASFGKIFFYSAIFVILIYPAITPIPFVYDFIENKLNIGISNFQKEMGYGINFIPRQEGYILVEYQELLEKYNFNFDKRKLDEVSGEEYKINIDEFSGVRLGRLGISNLSGWSALKLDEKEVKSNEAKFDEIKNLLLIKNYSMIAIGPKSGSTLIAQAFNSMPFSFKDQYCQVIIPNMEHLPITSIHIATVYLKNKRDCQTTYLKMMDYYDSMFGRICKKSRFAANNVVNIILMPFGRQKNCEKGGNFIDGFNHIALFPEHLVFIFVVFSLLLILYAPILKKYNRFNKKSYKFIYLLVIILMFMIIILFLREYYLDYSAHLKIISR